MYACTRGKLLQAAVHTLTQPFSVALRVLASFSCPGEGHRFYDVPVSYVKRRLSTRGMLTAFVLTAQAPREIGFSSLSAFAPTWISY